MPKRCWRRFRTPGAVFLGHYSPVAVGDYVAGPSHVLPTGGTARFASGLSANDFLRGAQRDRIRTRKGLAALADDVRMLADKEGLTAHQRRRQFDSSDEAMFASRKLTLPRCN